jgi:hypothetical protein
MAQIFQIVSDKFNVLGICSSENFAHKYIISYIIIKLQSLLPHHKDLSIWKKARIASSSQFFYLRLFKWNICYYLLQKQTVCNF